MAEQARTPLTQEEIQKKLVSHALWLKTNHREGARADFSNALLIGINFEGLVLAEVSFYNATIYHCNFTAAFLNDVSFVAAEISRCNFTSARLDGTDFSWAKVTSCDFSTAKHLVVVAFKRANLLASIMPEGFSFDDVIGYTNELIKKARNMFVGCLTFTLITMLVLLFGKRANPENITVNLPLIKQGITFSPHVGLILNLVAISILWAFFSLSLSAVKKQLDKVPARFPDGRFTYETVFPWFWVMWITETWQSDPSNDKHRLWQRLLLLSAASNVYYISIFITLLLFFAHCQRVIELLNAYPCYASVATLLFLAATLAAAHKSHHKSFLYFAGGGALAAWATVYCIAGINYTLIVALCMIVAWWWDNFTFSNESLSMDLSVPEASFYSKELKRISQYIEARFTFTNVTVALIIGTISAIYIWHHQL